MLVQGAQEDWNWELEVYKMALKGWKWHEEKLK